MKMLSVLVLAIFALCLGCTKTPAGNTVGCSVETIVTTAAAGAVASADNCSNVSQIQQDIQAKLGSINLCAAAQVQTQMSDLKKKQGDKLQGAIGNIVCPLAVDGVLSLISSGIPASWGCQGSTNIAASLSAACVAAVPL